MRIVKIRPGVNTAGIQIGLTLRNAGPARSVRFLKKLDLGDIIVMGTVHIRNHTAGEKHHPRQYRPLHSQSSLLNLISPDDTGASRLPGEKYLTLHCQLHDSRHALPCGIRQTPPGNHTVKTRTGKQTAVTGVPPGGGTADRSNRRKAGRVPPVCRMPRSVSMNGRDQQVAKVPGAGFRQARYKKGLLCRCAFLGLMQPCFQASACLQKRRPGDMRLRNQSSLKDHQ